MIVVLLGPKDIIAILRQKSLQETTWNLLIINQQWCMVYAGSMLRTERRRM